MEFKLTLLFVFNRKLEKIILQTKLPENGQKSQCHSG